MVKSNKLTLNTEKTKYMAFSSYATGLPKLGELYINSETSIVEAKNIKYLGITIDQQLKWDEHIKNLTNRIRGLLFKFKYLRDHLNNDKYLKIVYKALVQSQISYGIIGWGGTYQNHIRPLEVVQKWILKLIYRKPRTFSSHELFELAEVHDVRQLYAIKVLSNIQSKKITLNALQHDYTTRNRDKMYQTPRCMKTIGQRCFNYLAPKMYNVIPGDLKNIKNIKSFKRKLKAWMNVITRIQIKNLIDNT